MGCYLPTNAISSFAQQQQPDISKSAKYRLWTNKVLPALILAACCWLAFTVTEKGLASAYYFKANHYLELWQRKPQTLDLNSWQQAADAIKTAIKYHTNHPHYLVVQAQINEWAWYKGFKTAEQISINDQLYQSAILLRPNWPDAFANYAYYLGIINFRITEAFEQLSYARKFGPFTSNIYMNTISIGAARWQFLNQEQKKVVFEAVLFINQPGQISQYNEALTLLSDSGLSRVFCTYLRIRKAELPDANYKRAMRDYCK